MHGTGRRFPDEVSLSPTTPGLGNETTANYYRQEVRLSDIYGEYNALLTSFAGRSIMVAVEAMKAEGLGVVPKSQKGGG